MVTREVLGEELWECCEEEIKQVWRDASENDRWRIWHVDEVTAHILDTPEQLAECMARKKARPGRLI